METLAMTGMLSDGPQGLVYEREFLTRAEEAELLRTLTDLRFDPIVIRGQAARRTACHFGLGYNYLTRQPEPGEPLPGWLEPLRDRCGALAGVARDELVETLVQRYPPGSTIGWHRDAPAFGTIVGVSLEGACRFRFRRSTEPRTTWEIILDPRSAYVLSGEARSNWQHSIPPTKEPRYSITFRTLARHRKMG
jgi:DNA oxidative demethylase